MSSEDSRAGSKLVSVLLSALFAFGCAGSANEVTQDGTGADAQLTVDGLQRVEDSSYRYVWVKPDAEFASYRGVLFGEVEVYYRRKPRGTRYSSTSSNFALTDRQMSDLKDSLRSAFVAELTRDEFYELVDEAGQDTMLIEVSIIDLVVNVPTQGASPTQQTYTTSTAKMTLLMELRDSLSGEILARVADRQDARAPGFAMGHDLYHSNSVRDRSAVDRVFKEWARILRTRLDEVRTIEPTQKLDAGAEG